MSLISHSADRSARSCLDGVMRAFRSGLLFSTTSVALGGCATLYTAKATLDPPDIASIQIGVPRETVRRVLGEPIRQQDNVSVYEYFQPAKKAGLWMVPAAAMVEIYGLGTIGPQFRRAIIESTKQLNVAYAPNGKVAEYWHGGDADRPAATSFRLWLYERGRTRRVQDLDKSASRGYAPAQFMQAVRYRYGLWGTPVDSVSAYMWARLGAFAGYASAQETLAAWSATMSPDELAEGERRFKEWQPPGEAG
jgi:hypothetical protein